MDPLASPIKNSAPEPAPTVTLSRSGAEDALAAVALALDAAEADADMGAADFEPFRPLTRVARLLRAALAPAREAVPA